MVKRAQFIKDPYRLTKAMLREARSGSLTSTKEEVEEFLRAAYCDTHRGPRSGQPTKDQQCSTPIKHLHTTEPSWKEVKEVVKKTRTASAPGPSGLPYKIYKKCLLVLRRLWKLFWKIWAKGSVNSIMEDDRGLLCAKREGIF